MNTPAKDGNVVPIRDEYLTPEQAASEFKVSRKTIYNWRNLGILPKRTIGKRKAVVLRSDMQRAVVTNDDVVA